MQILGLINLFLLGLAHIFHAGFITPKQKFWCEKAMKDGADLPPPWTAVSEVNETYNETFLV